MLLERREATVIEIVDELDMLPAAISNNLKLLRMSGLVSAREEGRHVRYALADYTACALLRAASDGAVGQGHEIVELGCPEPVEQAA